MSNSAPEKLVVTTDALTPLNWEGHDIIRWMREGYKPATLTVPFDRRWLCEELTFEQVVNQFCDKFKLERHFTQYANRDGGLSAVRLENFPHTTTLVMRCSDLTDPKYSMYLDISTVPDVGVDVKDALALFNECTAETRTVKSDDNFFVAVIDHGELSYKAMPMTVDAGFIESNYTAEVAAAVKRATTSMTSPNPNGRLWIFSGPPGTGKTYICRHLINSCSKDAVFLYVKPMDVLRLVEPGALASILRFRERMPKKPLVFLVEDADDLLAPRGADNMAQVSSLLNLGDGILGDALDLRIVLTTNAKFNEFDPAITRAGRLNELVHVPPLSMTEAKAVLERLEVSDALFEQDKYTLAELYAKAKPHNGTKAKKKGIGF